MRAVSSHSKDRRAGSKKRTRTALARAFPGHHAKTTQLSKLSIENSLTVCCFSAERCRPARLEASGFERQIPRYRENTRPNGIYQCRTGDFVLRCVSHEKSKMNEDAGL